MTGIFGNIMILMVAGWARGLNKVGKEFMVNLALADLCVTGIAEPMCIIGTFSVFVPPYLRKSMNTFAHLPCKKR